MNQIVKPYLLRASILAAIVVIMGIILSLIVYSSVDKTRANAVDLVEQRIPLLTSVSNLSAGLSEQERIIYEYYRSQDGDVFTSTFADNNLLIRQYGEEIKNIAEFEHESAIIATNLHDIELLAEKFHYAMQLQDNNWDYLRELLTDISNHRLDLIPILASIEKMTRQAVKEGHSTTLEQLSQTHWVIIFYAVGIVLFGGLVSIYVKQYILTNAKNTRLALFAQRTPNPIISVDSQDKVVFFNPACEALLAELGLSADDVYRLLPANFIKLKQSMLEKKQVTHMLEQALNGHILQININHLTDINAYDIHLVDITQRKQAENKVEHLAFYVPQTHLPNQYKLAEDLTKQLETVEGAALGIFEIRDFGKMTSSLGVDIINSVVREMANVVVAKLPANVTLYQLNRNQFALVCSERHSAEHLIDLANSISHIVESPLITEFGEFFIELDFGFCLAPEHGKDVDTLLKNTSAALACSIAEPHHSFTLFKREYAEQVQKNAQLLGKLRNAVQMNELFLVFQPQLNLKDNRITGIETLVRWKHDDEIVSPADFIPLAEESGLIVSMGQWILEQACLFARQLVDLGYIDIVIAVNVSPRQFSHPNFCQNVVEALTSSRLPAKNLELEITEGIVMQNEQQTLAMLEQLKYLGIQLSIDDFGTGYSSLSYLKRFPVDKLKIDQSFIRDCHTNDEDKSIVKTIVALGRSLGLSLIAEGVEERQHIEFLRDISCDEIQGYWFSRPLEAEPLLAFLEQESTELAKIKA